ncbi:GerAB/ArcD/ProY family transporter [Brevibacillus sp. AY1]|uniref:GerAB/ArcD/ProY family transporter n=1 Tax=Brevibacillus sp. AY1 TaxID=2807621 RepID=UPI00245600D6|nr:GerAB/ArcD/ProY family transporter [Brevibacillus sp. AY1]MDH4618567.1 GerAB/ArcD/ProY family transporter [Brevibacillus sp. AY1]
MPVFDFTEIYNEYFLVHVRQYQYSFSRFNEVIQPATLLLLLIVLTQIFRETDFGRVLPVLGDGILPVLHAFPTVFFSLLGFEILLFIQPFMEKPTQALKASLLAIGTTVVLYTVLTVLSIAVMGSSEVVLNEYPTLSIIKNIEVPGAFLERLDSIMMMVWVPFAVTTIVMFHYCASLITSQLLKLQEHRVISLLFVPVVFLIAVLPRNILEVVEWNKWTSWLGATLISLVPLLLILESQRESTCAHLLIPDPASLAVRLLGSGGETGSSYRHGSRDRQSREKKWG